LSTHDYIVNNDTGAAVRADINNALAAIVSNNSSSSSPATTYAYQFWVDTTSSPNLLKIRSADNTTWITIGTVASANFGLLPLAGGTMTGQLLAAVLATLATPDIAFSGDGDTGIYRAGANLLGLVANATELLRADGVLGYIKLLGTAGFLAPSGTTAQRPTGVNGLVRYNSDNSAFEGYANSTWKGLGGGGGGAGFVWRDISGTAPLEAEENSEIVSLFQASLSQEIYAAIKVPQSYSAGTQIKIYVTAYSPSTSNNFSLLGQSTLIRTGTDAFTSTTNQRTTTNSALTNTVANQIREVILDVTDSSGQINSVAVSAGDIIKLRLYRNTDTDTADVRVIKNATDAKFS
jgi:hypothetical protein